MPRIENKVQANLFFFFVRPETLTNLKAIEERNQSEASTPAGIVGKTVFIILTSFEHYFQALLKYS